MPAPSLALGQLVARTDPRFWRFLVVGGVNTAFGYGLFVCLYHFSHLPLPVVVLLSNLGAVLFNFRSTGGLVFGNRDNRLFWRFVVNYAVLYGLNVGALDALLALKLGVYVASALLILPMAVLSFTLNKCFVFRKAA